MAAEDQIIYDNTETRKKADSIRVNYTDTEVSDLRRKAKTDLFWFAKTVLNFPDLSPNLHGHLCRWMQATNRFRFRLPLMPRGHFKSTIITIADSLQIVLPDDSSNQPFPRNLGTNARILLAHELLDSSAKNLKAITDKLYNAEFLLALFPEILPGKQHKVNKEQVELPRTEQWPETTFTIMGVGSSGQGNHFDMLKIDDIVGLKAMASPTEYATALAWVRDIPGMYTRMNETHVDFTGVRYAKQDVYRQIMTDYEGLIKVYTRSIWERNDRNEKVIIFPERINWEMIEFLKKQDLRKFNSQYMNNPKEISGEFEQDWERYYVKTGFDGRDVIYRDDAGIETKYDYRDLDRVCILDPAMTGNSGVVVTGTSPRKVNFVLEAIQEKLKTEALIQRVFNLYDKWNFRALVVESVLFSGLYEKIFKEEMQKRGKFFRVIMVTTKQKQKEDRVRVLRPYFANKQIIFHKDQEDLIEQFRSFPSDEYHMLDALAYGPEVWRASAGNDESDNRDEAIRKFQDQRSKTTGYSKIKYA